MHRIGLGVQRIRPSAKISLLDEIFVPIQFLECRFLKIFRVFRITYHSQGRPGLNQEGKPDSKNHISPTLTCFQRQGLITTAEHL